MKTKVHCKVGVKHSHFKMKVAALKNCLALQPLLPFPLDPQATNTSMLCAHICCQGESC